jgi:DNA mismatch repair protein MutS
MPDPRDTPAMRQYYRFKRQHPECALLFRIGDFYEMFDDDAVRVAKAIGLTLTQRTEGVPMCGVPHHQLETYLRKLLDAGFRVAVCEQTQDSAEVKQGQIVERAVTRVLTPGTLVDESLLDSDAPSALAAVCFTGEGEGSPAAAAVVDLSTGEFGVFDATGPALADELLRRGVSELLYAQTADGGAPPRVQAVLAALRLAGTPQPAWHFREQEAREALLRHYGVSTLEGFGLSPEDPAVRAAGAVVRYLQTTQLPADGAEGSAAPGASKLARTLRHLRPPRRDAEGCFCTLDATTLRALEVFRTIRAGGPGAGEADGSLLGVFAPSRTFPGCRTAMGRRLLREWLCRPLLDAGAIGERQRCVATLVEGRRTAEDLAGALSGVQDVARIAGRLALGRAGPRDLCALGRSLGQIAPLGAAIANAPAFERHARVIADLSLQLAPLAAAIGERCVEEPPFHLREGGLIRDGVDAELDEARRLKSDAAGWMAEYQARLIQEHGLPSLRVGFNKVFGYYIELPSAQSRRAPDAFSRKQTLKNAERYVTPELKEFEHRVTTAEARALAREVALFDELCARAQALIPAIATFADAAAELDALGCFAEKAHRRRWTRPEVVEGPALSVVQGRHPVLDERLEASFVPNDLELGGAGPALALITGPNMAGKSTYIRTAALLTLLAHTGSFVPAERMTVGLTDRIFTRIGADDALHAGQSTFMVEMTETARILNHATGRSLVILDEIGRGTSTLDGLSLAWAIAETLAGGGGKWQSGGVAERQSEEDNQRGTTPAHSATPPLRHSATSSPRTLFATHYHELTDLEDLLPGRVRNLHVSVREWGEEIVFLHRILPGRTDQSYGIHVAKLAGLPPSTIARARQILDSLAVHHVGGGGERGAAGSDGARGGRGRGRGGAPTPPTPPPPPRDGQLALFTEYVPHPAVSALREIKIESLTPLEAFDALRRLQGLTQEGLAQQGQAQTKA